MFPNNDVTLLKSQENVSCADSFTNIYWAKYELK